MVTGSLSARPAGLDTVPSTYSYALARHGRTIPRSSRWPHQQDGSMERASRYGVTRFASERPAMPSMVRKQGPSWSIA